MQNRNIGGDDCVDRVGTSFYNHDIFSDDVFLTPIIVPSVAAPLTLNLYHHAPASRLGCALTLSVKLSVKEVEGYEKLSRVKAVPPCIPNGFRYSLGTKSSVHVAARPDPTPEFELAGGLHGRPSVFLWRGFLAAL